MWIVISAVLAAAGLAGLFLGLRRLTKGSLQDKKHRWALIAGGVALAAGVTLFVTLGQSRGIVGCWQQRNAGNGGNVTGSLASVMKFNPDGTYVMGRTVIIGDREAVVESTRGTYTLEDGVMNRSDSEGNMYHEACSLKGDVLTFYNDLGTMRDPAAVFARVGNVDIRPDESAPLRGTWRILERRQGDSVIPQQENTYTEWTFNVFGTLIETQYTIVGEDLQASPLSSTYAVSGDTLTVGSAASGSTARWQIDGDQLTVTTDSGIVTVLQKQ